MRRDRRWEAEEGEGVEVGGDIRGHSSRWYLKSSGGSLPFTVWLNELFTFLCALSEARWQLNASSVASSRSRSFYVAIHRCM